MNVLELAQRHVQLRRAASTKGGEYTGMCPGCGDSGHDPASGPSDRFHVWPEERGGQGSYWCRACGAAGDAIQFLIDFEGKSYPEACAVLGIEAKGEGMAPRSVSRKRLSVDGFTPKTKCAPVDAWRKRAEKLVIESMGRIHSEPSVLKWLSGRGIDGDAIEKFRIGWIDKNIFRTRESWGLESELKKGSGVPKKLFIPRGILIPSFSSDGVYHLQVRRPKADIDETKGQKKYYIVPGSKPMAMIIGRDKNAFVVVETKLDAALIHQHAGDLVGTVAMVSSSNKPDEQCHQTLSAAACILVALDFDTAGKKGWPFWDKTYPEAERWPVPVGKDPGEAFEKGIDIRTWILAGLPPAWHVGPAPMTPRGRRVEKGRGGDTPPAKDERNDSEASPESAPTPIESSVSELKNILLKYPVRIRATRKRTSLIYPKGFRNDEVLQRASRLLFFDDACWGYVHNHRADIVDRTNMEKT